MLLTTVDRVRRKYSFDDISDVNDAAKSALTASTTYLAAALRSEFASAAKTDTFYVNTWSFRGSNIETGVPMLLKQGFVAASPAPVVTFATTYTDLSTSSAVDITAYCIVNYEKGLVTVMDYDVSDGYVKVAYTAGFSVTTGDAELYDQSEVPEWLKEAALAHSAIQLASSPAFNSEGATRTPLEDMRASVAAIVDSNVRYAPGALKPITG